ncbi:MAG: TetR/AcrR family transcriptional regulator [Verrucomicrobiota bacterium]
MAPVRQPEETRMKILETALDLFHRGTFKGTSVNQIVDQAGITKGALFHHFKGKNELGYAVVDELLLGHVNEAWVEPLSTSVDPLSDLMAIINGFREEMEECAEVVECGCPLNNLSQEMSALDDEFRLRLLKLYNIWEEAIEKALRAGIDAGNVKADVDPLVMSKTLVALLEGCIGMIKVNRTMEHMMIIGAGIRTVLDSMKP